SPQPQDSQSGVLVAVQHQPAARADMRAHAERLLDALRAPGTVGQDARAVLAGERGWYRHHSTASVCCFALEQAPKRRPAGIADALGQMGVADQVGHPQVFERDHVVAPQQRERGLVMGVAALPLYLLVLALEHGDRAPAVLALLLASGDAP